METQRKRPRWRKQPKKCRSQCWTTRSLFFLHLQSHLPLLLLGSPYLSVSRSVYSPPPQVRSRAIKALCRLLMHAPSAALALKEGSLAALVSMAVQPTQLEEFRSLEQLEAREVPPQKKKKIDT